MSEMDTPGKIDTSGFNFWMVQSEYAINKMQSVRLHTK